MLEILNNNKEFTMTSLDVVDLVNKLRKEEGNTTKKEHKTLMRDIRKELEDLANAGVKDGYNFVLISYIDNSDREKPCYSMTKAGIMQMLNKESAYVRYKTQQYIEALENKIDNLSNINQVHTTTDYEKFVPNPLNRIDFTIEPITGAYKNLKIDIKKKGYNTEPIIVNELSNGKLLVIAGHHRWWSCKTTESKLRYIIDNTFTMETAILQDTTTSTRWENNNIYEYGLKLEIPYCQLFEEMYERYQGIICINNIWHLVGRFLSRKELKLERKYMQHSTLFNKIKVGKIDEAKQIVVTPNDKARLIKFLDKFVNFYSFTDYEPTAKHIENFIINYRYMCNDWDIIIKNWKKVNKHLDGDYPNCYNIYRNLKNATHGAYEIGLRLLINMTRIS